MSSSSDQEEDSLLAEGFYDDPSQLSQLLRERGSSQPPYQFTDPTLHQQSTHAPLIEEQSRKVPHHDIARQLPAAFPSPRELPPRRAKLDPRYVKPGLPKHDTAPTITGLVTEREGAAKMNQTFDGVLDAPGDTQPDSQIFKQFTSMILESRERSTMLPTPPPLHIGDDGVSADAPTDEVTGSSQSRCSPTTTSPSAMNDDPETQYRNDPPTSSFKFETPAITDKKRDSQGQVLSSAVKTDTTPGTDLSASHFFGFGNSGNANAVSLTQVFNATQAATSPVVGAPSEDAVFQRPSPNFARRSSPPVALSSPITDVREEPTTSPSLRSSSEPRADYETMRQSQERRSRGPADKEVRTETQDSFEVPTAIELHYNKQKEKERLEKKAAKLLAGVSAPSPTNRRGRNPRQHELSQDTHPAPRKRSTSVNEDDAENQVQVPNTSSHPLRALSRQSSRNTSQPDIAPSQLQPESRFRVPTSQLLYRSVVVSESSKGHDIVMDSQPDPNADALAMPHPKDLRFPSSPSSNQYSVNQTTMNGHTGFTSQVVSSSVPPMPPCSSAREDSREELLEDENQRVPSSPPIVSQTSQVDEITYDEHAYDEYPEDGHESDNNARATHEDVEMDDDDDGLPVVPEEKNQVEATPTEDSLVPTQPIVEDTEMRDDHEIPETMEQVQSLEFHDEDEELIRSSHPDNNLLQDSEKRVASSRAERQSTIPETDMLDTQPTFFPIPESAPPSESHIEESTIGDTNSTDLQPTGQEQQTASPAGKAPTSSAGAGTTLQSPAGPKVRSLIDIANQPDTQRSTELQDIEIPQLSFAVDANDSAAAVLGTSPARPSKRRKVIYSTKKPRGSVEDTDPASEHKPSSPVKNSCAESIWTPPLASTQNREEQGALAVARAPEEMVYAQPVATLKTKGLRKLNSPRTPRNGALKPVDRALLTRTPEKILPKSAARKAKTPTRPASSTEAPETDTEMHVVAGPAGPAPEVLENDPVIVDATDDGEAPTGELLCPHRVFAFWPGNNYYPATCLGRAGLNSLRIRYDDGNETELEAGQVRAFDLHLGDHVKVDEPGMKIHSYIVVGFKNKISVNEADDFPVTDCHGYTTVVLEEKSRDSLPATKAKKSLKHMDAPMGSLYFTNTLWGKIRDRTYRHTPSTSPVATASRTGTPIAPESSAMFTPTMSRRSFGISHLRETFARATSVASSVRSTGTTFSNMAFALSFSQDSVDKDAIARLIKSNGGQILDFGFSELFDGDAFDKSTSDSTAKMISGLDGLLLKREYKNLGFVATISDGHSRKTKHIQALALNIPCLHLRWIHDSLSASRPLPFVKYLLPAGESTFLDPTGVVRSRNMNVYDPAAEDVRFVQMLKERPLLLAQQTVLLITGRSKKQMENREPYMFLTNALGPHDVTTCNDLAAAKDMLQNGDWDWVYVNGGAEGVAEAATTFFGNGSTKSTAGKKKYGGKKRKRDEDSEPEPLVRSGTKGGKKVKVVGDEFVIQSLILGALVEE